MTSVGARLGFARTVGVSSIKASSISAIVIMTNAVETNRIFGSPQNWCEFIELQRQLERTAVGFGELKVEQAEIRGLGSGAHQAGDPLAGVERKAYSQRPTDK
jgi:hypothetical protein